jgi:hypothetical protein
MQFCGAASLGNLACWLVPFVTYGAAGAMGPAYTRALVSLEFHCEDSRSCSSGEHRAQSSCVCQEVGLTTKGLLNNGA